MSTDHQKYSTENQSDAIRKYAEERGFELVRSYADAGKSGLRIEGREALQQLIQDVQDGTADFEVIFVYDVSRWGRFQDADESAYYEYICRRANKHRMRRLLPIDFTRFPALTERRVSLWSSEGDGDGGRWVWV